jgi:uncharacterized protein (DUF4415 family)
MSKKDDEKWAEARRKALRDLATTTDEEDAEITAAALRDPDNPPWTDEMWARARPAAEAMPEFIANWRKWRGKQKAPVKKLVSLRLDPDVIEHFRAAGPGWQGRINDALRKVARLRSPAKAAQAKPAALKRPAKAAAR